ncbi:cytochrome b-c1 complex subunit 8 [Galendromus occidentalis]|uniref:Cytochrome b-c1 complex subunit 8 n=1 Tax=Galendromus occidentalis TaxID=34638 RepID=A0AAJ6QV19_9ACAR|nr:cytochrome b-c1 complex subunit 8 [Galendromus occidentalis]XP_018495717.1 cytochrome b-c1 complex subunit 8 [Galendromus occidentalis]
MGLFFGNLFKGIRGVVYYRVSHYEQNPFKGIISQGVPNMVRRINDQIFYILPPALFYYALYDWAVKENKRLSRKNPADYENDV